MRPLSLAERRLYRLDEPCDLWKSLRDLGLRLVTVNGAFGILHYGHICFLEEAKKQGDVLIVGVNSDASYRLHKDARGPIVGQHDRGATLLALRAVDYVVTFDETTPIRLLRVVVPHVHVNGIEYGEDCVEADVVREIGARLHVVARSPRRSTSALVRRIVHRHLRQRG